MALVVVLAGRLVHLHLPVLVRTKAVLEAAVVALSTPPIPLRPVPLEAQLQGPQEVAVLRVHRLAYLVQRGRVAKAVAGDLAARPPEVPEVPADNPQVVVVVEVLLSTVTILGLVASVAPACVGCTHGDG